MHQDRSLKAELRFSRDGEAYLVYDALASHEDVTLPRRGSTGSASARRAARAARLAAALTGGRRG